MKFKAKLSLQHTQLFYNIINPLSRLHSSSSANEGPGGPFATNSSSSNGGYGTSTILYLDNDKLVLSTRGSSHKNDSEGIFCFAELVTTDGIFNHHVIQSVENENAILMEVCLLQLKTALRGVLDTQKDFEGGRSIAAMLSQEVTMKLAKRNGGMPHLCLDVKDVHVGEGGIGVHHSIPVRIMRVDELQYHVPPLLGMPDVQLELPKDRPLKAVVERLKGIGPQVYIEGNMAGVLTLGIVGDGASIRTSFNKLIPIHEDCKSKSSQQHSQTQNDDVDMNIDTNGSGGGRGERNSGTPSQMSSQSSQRSTTQIETQSPSQTQNEPVKCTVKLDSKKLHASLHWQGTLGVKDVSSAVLCMWENEMLVLDVTLNPEIGRFMYYIPVHFVSADEMHLD